MLKTVLLRSVGSIAATLLLLSCPARAEESSEVYNQEQLRNDVRALVAYLEEAHPDPYRRSGGRIGFHRRAADILQAIPEAGLSRQEFYELLLPLVVAVRDGHTRLHEKRLAQSEPGLPFSWRIFDEGMYIAEVFSESHRHLLGARLVAVEGVPYQQLVNRQAQRSGYDNQYDNLRHLRDSLSRAEALQKLLPGWRPDPGLKVAVELVSGESETAVVLRGDRTPESTIAFASRIEMAASAAKDPAYTFLDEARQIALFRSESMMEYREAFESWFASGNWSENRVRAAQKIFERVHGGVPPDDPQQLIAAIPSATRTILDLFEEMKEAGTQTLIVDLRRNQGGNSMMSWIFSYVLHGSRKSLAANADRFQVRRYSQLYFDNNHNRSIESIRESLGEPLEVGDYSFAGLREFEAYRAGDLAITDDDVASVRRYLEEVPSCAPLFEDPEKEALYQPKNVVLLCSSVTYSAGFDLLVDLYKAGAVLVGTPSAQTANCFIDSIRFQLPQTGITGNLSCKYRELFPGDPVRGEVLEPHHRLSYELWAGYDFDPHAEVLLALERLGLQSELR